jgi:gliding motility-associated-like protein
MEDNDFIKDLFKDKLEHLESNVNADLWSSLSKKIPSNQAVSVGKVLIKKVLIGTSAAAVVVGSVIWYLNKQENSAVDNNNLTKNNTGPVKEEFVVNKIDSISTSIRTVESVEKAPYVHDIFTNESIDLGLLMPENKDDINDQQDLIVEPVPMEFRVNQQSVPEVKDVVQLPIIENIETSSAEVEKPTSSQEEEESVSESIVETYFISDLPNIFTPNNDLINDNLTVSSEGINEFYLIVLNQSNQIVFASSDSNFSWDGIGLNGDKVLPGDYVYYITGKDKNGAPIYKYSLLRITY